MSTMATTTTTAPTTATNAPVLRQLPLSELRNELNTFAIESRHVRSRSRALQQGSTAAFVASATATPPLKKRTVRATVIHSITKRLKSVQRLIAGRNNKHRRSRSRAIHQPHFEQLATHTSIPAPAVTVEDVVPTPTIDVTSETLVSESSAKDNEICALRSELSLCRMTIAEHAADLHRAEETIAELRFALECERAANAQHVTRASALAAELAAATSGIASAAQPQEIVYSDTPTLQHALLMTTPAYPAVPTASPLLDNRAAIDDEQMSPPTTPKQTPPPPPTSSSKALMSPAQRRVAATVAALRDFDLSPTSASTPFKNFASRTPIKLPATPTPIPAQSPSELTLPLVFTESELAAIPLISPSTPDSKRRRISLAIPKVARPLVSPQARAVTDTSVIVSPPQNSPIKLVVGDSDVTVDVAAVLIDSSDETAVLTSAAAKRIVQELKRCRAVLSDMKNDWNLRVTAMHTIEDIAREPGIGRWSQWREELELLRQPLCDQLTDLRSSIVRETCRLILALCFTNSEIFERELEIYIPLLCKGLYITIKVISTACDECIRELINHICDNNSNNNNDNNNKNIIINVMINQLNDVHAIVRERALSYLTAIVSRWNNNNINADHPSVESVAQAISIHINDSDNATRASSRALFRAFALHFTNRANLLMEDFTPVTLRTLKSESTGQRKATTGKSKASIKRKK